VNQFENPSAYKDQVIATGLPASPGAAVGQIVFTAEDAEAAQAQGKPAILVHMLKQQSFSECIWQAPYCVSLVLYHENFLVFCEYR
jgi:hypothetical protein